MLQFRVAFATRSKHAIVEYNRRRRPTLRASLRVPPCAKSGAGSPRGPETNRAPWRRCGRPSSPEHRRRLGDDLPSSSAGVSQACLSSRVSSSMTTPSNSKITSSHLQPMRSSCNGGLCRLGLSPLFRGGRVGVTPTTSPLKSSLPPPPGSFGSPSCRDSPPTTSALTGQSVSPYIGLATRATIRRPRKVVPRGRNGRREVSSSAGGR